MFLQDPLTGAIENVMRTPYKKAHRLGGTLEVKLNESKAPSQVKSVGSDETEEDIISQIISSKQFQDYGMKLFMCYEMNTCNDLKKPVKKTFSPLKSFM